MADLYCGRWEPAESFDGSEQLLERFWERTNTEGRDVKNIHLFAVGEVFYPIGPPSTSLIHNFFRIITENVFLIGRD
jgi:hypothetical protein